MSVQSPTNTHVQVLTTTTSLVLGRGRYDAAPKRVRLGSHQRQLASRRLFSTRVRVLLLLLRRSSLPPHTLLGRPGPSTRHPRSTSQPSPPQPPACCKSEGRQASRVPQRRRARHIALYPSVLFSIVWLILKPASHSRTHSPRTKSPTQTTEPPPGLCPSRSSHSPQQLASHEARRLLPRPLPPPPRPGLPPSLPPFHLHRAHDSGLRALVHVLPAVGRERRGGPD